MDRLEKFIVENRTEFDKAVPSLKVWAAIDRELESPRKVRFRLMYTLRIAAAVAVLLFVGGLGGVYFFQQDQPSISLAEIAPEYGELEQFYNVQVNERLNELATYRQVDAVASDLRQLDQILNDLRKELQDAPAGSEEQIVQAMIKNYKIKLEILERVLEKVQSTNQETLKINNDEISI